MSATRTNRMRDGAVMTGDGVSLRATLVIDAISSGAMGLAALLGRGWLSGWLGLSEPVLIVAGIILVLAVALVGLTATVAAQPGPLLWLVTLGNAAWVVLSIAWIIAQASVLTTFGVILIAAQAVVVTLYVLRYRQSLR